MEELQQTQEYAGNIERRRMQQPYTGEDRRKRAPWTGPVGGSGEHLVAEGADGDAPAGDNEDDDQDLQSRKRDPDGERDQLQQRAAWPFADPNKKQSPR